jgi:hypothetical protein
VRKPLRNRRRLRRIHKSTPDVGQHCIAVTEASGRTTPVHPKRGLRTHAPLLKTLPCTSGLLAGVKSSLQGERELTMYGESSTELNGAHLPSGPQMTCLKRSVQSGSLTFAEILSICMQHCISYNIVIQICIRSTE